MNNDKKGDQKLGRLNNMKDNTQEEYVFSPDNLKLYSMSLVMRILSKHNICTLLETKDKSNRNNDFIKKTYKENKRL